MNKYIDRIKNISFEKVFYYIIITNIIAIIVLLNPNTTNIIKFIATIITTSNLGILLYYRPKKLNT